ncbi:MAG: extracellular solute-binding protein [Chloroflexi bacterium]|nr:extracellular solute-binding protein [Chloroflexota bacterium]
MTRRLGPMAVLVLALSACGGVAPASDPASAAGSETITLYTSTTQETVDALLAAFGEAHPDIAVEVFRAPTGEINARIAAEQREGAVRGDVLWLSDPLSIQQYDADGLLRAWTPTELDAVPEAYRTERFWGTRLLNVVLIHGADIDPAPVSWADLADPAYADSVAITDPGFAGSAFGALGYFATSDEFGFDFYRDLAANGADQLSAPDEVVTGVAEGRYAAGITIETPAQAAVANGSPIEVVWPEPGAIAVYSPIAVFEDAANAAGAETFVDFILSEAGQTIIGEFGFQPIREGIEGPPSQGEQVAPDWPAIFDRSDELLEEYRSIFGG